MISEKELAGKSVYSEDTTLDKGEEEQGWMEKIYKSLHHRAPKELFPLPSSHLTILLTITTPSPLDIPETSSP